MTLILLSTRPYKEKDALLRAIQAAQIEVIPCPMFEIKPTKSTWILRLPSLLTIHDAIFTSPNAALYFFKGLEKKNIAWPRAIQTSAIGPGTRAQLEFMKIRVDFVPPQANSENLLSMDHFQQINKKNILLIKGIGGRRLIPTTLWKRGADLSIINVYKRSACKHFSNLEAVTTADIILFSSEQGMRHFVTLTNNAFTIPCLVISPRLAAIAHNLGFKTIITSTIDSLVETLHHFKQGLTNDRTQ